MNCESVRTLLNSFIDGETSELESRRISQHVAECASCAEEARQYRLTRDLVSEFGAELAPDNLLNSVRMEMQKEPRKAPTPISKYRNTMALAATFLIVILGGLYIGILKQGPGGMQVSNEVAKMPAAPVVLDKAEVPGVAKMAEADSTEEALVEALAAADGETRPETPSLVRSEPELMAAEPEKSEPRPVADKTGTITRTDPTSGAAGTAPEAPRVAVAEITADTAPTEPEPEYEESAPGVRSLRGRNEPMAEMPADEYEGEAPGSRSLASRNEPMAEQPSDEYETDAPALRNLGGRNEPMASLPDDEYEDDAPALRSLGDREEPASDMTQAEVVREEVRLALNEKEIELAEETTGAEDEDYRTRGLSFAAATHRRSPSPAPSIVPAALSSGGGQAGFNYFNVPSGSDVMEFVVRNSIAVQHVEKPVKMKAAANEVVSGNFVRAANIFFSTAPESASDECEKFISDTLAVAGDSRAAWKRNGNYFIVQGSFSTMAPLRVHLAEEFSTVATGTAKMDDTEIVTAASSSHGIPPDYPAVLEVRFFQE